MRLHFLTFIGLLLLVTSCQSHDYLPQEGDLLFQDINCGDLCTAIETVTEGYKGAKFSHVGMVYHVSDDSIGVIEAIGSKVQVNSLETFLARSQEEDGTSRVMVGRLKEKNAQHLPDMLQIATKYIGLPYDNIYVMNDSSFYCSELIHDITKVAIGENDWFSVQPMTFKDPATNDFFPAWVDYYQELAVNIPEGEPGLNPGSMSRSNVIDIIHIFGEPQGYIPN